MIARRSNCRGGRRRGFGLVEMAMTGVLIAAGLAVTVQVVGWVARERRAVERRERAVLEASNLLERVAARPHDGLTAESLGEVRMSGASAAFLPGAALGWKVTPFDDPPARKKVVIEIRWRGRDGRGEAPVRLVAWSYRRGEVAR